MIKIDPEDELICLRAGATPQSHDGAMMPPLVQASLFRKQTIQDLLDGLSREHEEFVYSRGSNPTVRVLEETLAALERAEACKCFASGMGAVSAVLFGLLKAGDHVLFVNDVYGPSIELAERLTDFGVAYSRTYAVDVETIENELRDETQIIFMESPGSTLFRLLPVKDITAMAKSRSILTVLDNTVATPILQKPILMGVDLVIHSCSKYIGGHSDVIGGAVLGSRKLIQQIFYKAYMLLGAVMAPFDAWLLLRGVLTLPGRMQRHHKDALSIAKFLQTHPRIRHVYHPALTADDNELMRTQMVGHSGLFSVALDVDTFPDVLVIVNRLKLFGKAVSWGGVESLVMTGHKSDPGDDQGLRAPKTLLRFSIGFEGVDNLTADLQRALS